MGSSQTRAQTHVPCIGRQILNHCTTRKAPNLLLMHVDIQFSQHHVLKSLSFPAECSWPPCCKSFDCICESLFLSSLFYPIGLYVCLDSSITLGFFCFFFFKDSSHLFFFKFIYLFLAVLGLRFCVRAFSSCSKRGPLTITASLVAEHRLQTRRLSSCGSRGQFLRGMWDLPRPGLEPVCPALAGRFSTTAPPGKPHTVLITVAFQ